MAAQWHEPISDHAIPQGTEADWFHPKKKSYGYQERDEAQRQASLAQLQAYCAEQVVYVDEAGVDDTEDDAYGWCDQSERFEALKLGQQQERISMIAAWCHPQVVAPLTLTGYCDTALVKTWVQQCLVGQLQPGQVVVMDNASFHKSTLIRELIEPAGCTLLFLPPYSPDLNKIEKFWARLKHYLRKRLNQFQNLWDAVDNAFLHLS